MSDGKFRPGVSGNPSGRPKESILVKELARTYTERAILVLAAALDDPKLRVQAAQALLDRGWGKPAQVVGGDPDGAPMTFKGLVEFVQRKADQA